MPLPPSQTARQKAVRGHWAQGHFMPCFFQKRADTVGHVVPEKATDQSILKISSLVFPVKAGGQAT